MVLDTTRNIIRGIVLSLAPIIIIAIYFLATKCRITSMVHIHPNTTSEHAGPNHGSARFATIETQ
jgi:Na+-translocating ferredoxin:NAD+ oxidoreductase RnfD subunit